MERLDSLAARLGIRDLNEALRQNWDASQAEYPGSEHAFPDDARYQENARWLGMPAAFQDALGRALPELRVDENLSRYLWLCRWVMESPHARWPFMGAGFPPVAAGVSPAAGMGFAIVVLALLDIALLRYRARGISDDVIRDTFSDFARWVEEYRRKQRVWGLSNLGWMQHHLRARIFKLGRLQFKMETYGYDFHAWRNRETGRVLVLAGLGMRFYASGLALAADGQTGLPADAWTADYREEDDAVRGHPIDPRGKGVPRMIALKRTEWAPVLRKDDPTIGIHIPAGGPMDFGACGESLARVGPFFGRHVPDHQARALTCGSWLLDPQFEGRLSDGSNIVRFQRELYLYPLPGGGDAGLFERVFDNRRPRADESLAGMSRLQRAVLEHGRNGGVWRSGGALLWGKDLGWARQVYRRMWPEAEFARRWE